MVSLTTELAKEPRGLKLKCLPLKLRVYYRCHSSLSTTLAGKPWRLSMVFCLGLCSRMCHHYLSPDSLNSTSPQTPCTLPVGPHTYEGWQQNEKSLWFFTIVDPNLHRPRIPTLSSSHTHRAQGQPLFPWQGPRAGILVTKSQ